MWLSIFLLLSSSGAESFHAESIALDRAGSLRVCHFSDLHGHIESAAERRVVCPQTGASLSQITKLKMLLDIYCPLPSHLRFFTGDLMHGSPPFDHLELAPARYGVAAEILSYLKISAWIPGNHEFHPSSSYLPRITANIPLIVTNANINNMTDLSEEADSPSDEYYSRGVRTLLERTHRHALIFSMDKGKRNLCLFGWLPSDLAEISYPPKGVFVVDDYTAAIVSAMTQLWPLCAADSSLRILLSHAGLNDDVEYNEALERWFYLHKKMLRRKSNAPLFHAILGGHSHTRISPKNYPLRIGPFGNRTALSHTACKNDLLGVLSFSLDANGQWTIDSNSTTIPIDSVQTASDHYCDMDARFLRDAREEIASGGYEKI